MQLAIVMALPQLSALVQFQTCQSQSPDLACTKTLLVCYCIDSAATGHNRTGRLHILDCIYRLDVDVNRAKM